MSTNKEQLLQEFNKLTQELNELIAKRNQIIGKLEYIDELERESVKKAEEPKKKEVK